MSETYRLSADASPADKADHSTNETVAPLTNASGRLVSLDAYRGFIMLMLAASGFGIARFASAPDDAPVWQYRDYQTWQELEFQFSHPAWESKFGLMGVAFWDLIQPAFMFMVGVAMPFSYARRETFGQSTVRRFAHAAWRAIVLILLGVFLSTSAGDRTNWIFPNVLAQIGLGYLFAYALLGRKPWVQWTALIAILAGTWFAFEQYTPPANDDPTTRNASVEAGEIFEGKFAKWSKNANVFSAFDVQFLNLLRNPSPEDLEAVGARHRASDWAPGWLVEWFFARTDAFAFNSGGYQTLNFVPSIATMLLGIMCGQFLIRRRESWKEHHWQTAGLLVAAGAVSMIAALAAHQFACPIVKRIWTPSWVLFSGAYVIWMLAVFYVLFDVLPLSKLAFPLIVVGMNSIAAYMMGQMLRPWAINKVVHSHLEGILTTMFGADALADEMYGRLIDPTMAFVVFWLILFWMYRQKYFVRV